MRRITPDLLPDGSRRYSDESVEELIKIYEREGGLEKAGKVTGINSGTLSRVFKRYGYKPVSKRLKGQPGVAAFDPVRQEVEEAAEAKAAKETAAKIAREFKTGGRRQGSQNRNTTQVRNEILSIFSVGDLLAWAKKNPSQYFALVGKILPKDMTVRTISRFEDLGPDELSALKNQIQNELELKKQEEAQGKVLNLVRKEQA